jgi:hypothetical protein
MLTSIGLGENVESLIRDAERFLDRIEAYLRDSGNEVSG